MAASNPSMTSIECCSRTSSISSFRITKSAARNLKSSAAADRSGLVPLCENRCARANAVKQSQNDFSPIISLSWFFLVSMFAFIFDIDGTLVDSNELHVDSWDRAFPLEQLRAQIGKGSDQYLPEFLTPDEIERFGKELDEYRSDLFRKEYLPKVRPFLKVHE